MRARVRVCVCVCICVYVCVCVKVPTAYIKDGEPIPDRTVEFNHFANKQEYLLSLVGKTVGPGCLWRFPFLVYTHGGGE